MSLVPSSGSMIWILTLFYFIFFFLPSFSFSFCYWATTNNSSLVGYRDCCGTVPVPIYVSYCRWYTRTYSIIRSLWRRRRGIWRNGVFIYNHFSRRNNTEGWRCYTHAGGPGREWGGKKWRKYHTPHTSLPGEEIVSKDDYNYTTGVLVGFDWVFFLFLLLFLFLLFTPSPSSLASPATCTEGNRLIEYWADSAALHWAFVLQWEGIHISVYMHV